MYFRKYAIDMRASWASKVEFYPREERGRRGRLGQQPSGPQGRPGRKQGKRISELKIGFLNLPMLWKFVQGDLGGILTHRFFLNSSRILEDFRKIQYAMP
jgi:hypothetical protein